MKFRPTVLYFAFAALASISAGAESADHAVHDSVEAGAADARDPRDSVQTTTYTNGDSTVAITKYVSRVTNLCEVRIIVSVRPGQVL